MPSLLYIVSPAMAAMAFIVLASAAGDLVSRRLRLEFHSAPERWSTGAALGLGATATVFFLLGLAGFFTRGIFAAVLAISSGAWLWLRCGRQAPVRATVRTGPHLLLLPFVLPMFLLALYPPLEWDSMHYHLPLIKAYLRDGQIAPVLHLRFPVLAQMIEILYSVPVAFSMDSAAHAMSVGFTALTCLALFAAGLRHADGLTGLMAAASYASFPIVVWLGNSADIDTGVAFFSTTAFLAFFNWRETGGSGWLTVSALVAGFSACSKYTGLALMAALAILTIATRNPPWRKGVRFLVTSCAVAIPWYAYTAWHTGNPVWPLAQHVFGFWHWSAQDLAAQLENFAKHGMGRSLPALLLAPWHLAFHPMRFDAQIDNGQFGFLAFYLLPPALALFREKPWMRMSALIALLGLLAWFFSSQVMRYLLPVVPVACLASMHLVRRGFLFVPRLDRHLQSPLGGTLLAGLLLVPGARAAWEMVLEYGPVPSSPAARVELIQRTWPNYEVAEFLNRREGTNVVLYSIYGQNLNCFVEGRILGEISGPYRYTRIHDAMQRGERALLDELRALGVNYLQIYVDGIPDDAWQSWPTWEYLRPVFGSGYSAIFAVTKRPVRPHPAPEAITLENFELVRGRHGPRSAITPVGATSLFQLDVAVEPTDETAAPLLVASWTDGEHRIVRTDDIRPQIGTAARASYFLTAPESAVWVRVETAGRNARPVRVKRLTLRPLHHVASGGNN